MKASVHPFPARMAPELALNSLKNLKNATILDPMTGSGTVARVAQSAGLSAIGFDLDPLAVLISKVGTTPLKNEIISIYESKLFERIEKLKDKEVILPWIDEDKDAQKFIEYWFGESQRKDLRRIAYLLSSDEDFKIPGEVGNVFRVALSRIIVTKKQAASLAQDTSHSRPHRTSQESSYNVIEGFTQSLKALKKRVAVIPNTGKVEIHHGDARDLSIILDRSIDVVLTSPPYLNAIDYMRGHRMSLIWLGHKYSDLSQTRSNSIGSERRPDTAFDSDALKSVKDAMGEISSLPSRYNGMIDRYVIDLHKMVDEVARVIKVGGTATFVMGDSCLKGVYIQNSGALAEAAKKVGLSQISRTERDLPSGSRYLPTPTSGSLSKRMRKEVILSFTKE